MIRIITTTVLLASLFVSCSSVEEYEINNYRGERINCISNRDTGLFLPEIIDSILEKKESKSGVYVLEDGGSSLISRAWFTEYATQSIDIQYFIFSTDNVGLIACDYLIKAADRGVRIRMIVDDVLVDVGVRELATLSAHKNIEIKVFNPGMNVGKNLFTKVKNVATDFVSVNKRMHNKTFVVDNRVVITGGRNIADEYYDYDHDYNFRDRDVLLLGEITSDVSRSFQEFWNHELSVSVEDLTDEITYDSTLYNALHNYACDTLNFWPEIRKRINSYPQVLNAMVTENGAMTWVDSIFYVSDSPEKNTSNGLYGGGTTTDTLLSLIKNARKSIDIQTPYLVTTERSRKVFKQAVDKGVKVRILTNSLASTDNLEAFNGYQRDREALLITGIEIYEFKPDAESRYKTMTGALQKKLNFTPVFGLHAKTMVLDDKITVIGTFNLDPRSANLNTECLTIIHSKDVTDKVLSLMNTEFNAQNAWRTTLDFNPDGEVDETKRFKTWTRKIVPKGIL